MSARIMHRLAVKVRAVFCGSRAPSRHWPVIALAVIEMMIDVSVEMLRSVVPRPSADKYTAGEPLRSIVAVWSAVVRRNFVVSVRTHRCFSNTDCDLRGRLIDRNNEKAPDCDHKDDVSHVCRRLPFTGGPTPMAPARRREHVSEVLLCNALITIKTGC